MRAEDQDSIYTRAGKIPPPISARGRENVFRFKYADSLGKPFDLATVCIL